MRPTPTKSGSGSAAPVATGQPVIYGACPWPDPYLMARAVPGMGRQGVSICMPEIHSTSYTEPSPAQNTTMQVPPTSLARNEVPSLYNTIPKAQASDSTPPYQPAPSSTSYAPYSTGSNGGSQAEISSPVQKSTPPYQVPTSNTSYASYRAGPNSGSQVEISSPAPTNTVTPPDQEEEVPVQFNKVEAKPARQVTCSLCSCSWMWLVS